MLYIKRSMPPPSCLKKEKKKKNGTYRCGNVATRLKEDFFNKCYICESINGKSNIEHRQPHRNGRYKNLKFDWFNLFWSCAHCNSIKQYTNMNDILDCTKDKDIEEKISYKIDPLPFYRPIFEALSKDQQTINTIELLNNIFQGVEPKSKNVDKNMNEFDAEDKTELLKNEILQFYNLISEYFEPSCYGNDKKICRKTIRKKLHKSSIFVSFKRWIVRTQSQYMNEFGKYLN